MQSRLQLFCKALMETAWLTAAAIIPLFFNVSSLQIFEPDKMYVLKFLTVVSGCAWLLARLSAGRQNTLAGLRSFLQNPLVKPIVVLGGLYVLSTIFSIAPSVSFWGLYARAQGSVAFFCYLIICLVLISELKTSEQLNRLQFAFLIASIPVSTYGILQGLGVGSIATAGNFTRSLGAAGNPIFLGAYLIMVIPLTFCRFIEGWRALRGGRKSGFARLLLCGAALLLQGAALVYTQSRGPVIGLAIAGYICVFMFFVIHRAGHGRGLALYALAGGIGLAAPLLMAAVVRFTSGLPPRAVIACLLSAVALIAAIYIWLWHTQWGRGRLWVVWLAQPVALIVVLAYPASFMPASNIGSSFGHFSEYSDGSVGVRISLWETEIGYLRSGAPAVLPDGTHDSAHLLRPAIGYGPECVWAAANTHAVPKLVELTPDETVDRMHNELYDGLIETGSAGALAFLFLIAAGIFYSLRYLGFIPGPREKAAFILFSVFGCLAGLLGPLAFKASHYIGVGIEFGLIGGVFLFIAWNGFRKLSNEISIQTRMFGLGILGAIVAHFIEAAVGIPCTPTKLYLFLLLGLLSVLSSRNLAEREEVSLKKITKGARWYKNPALPYAMITGIIVLVISWSFTFNAEDVPSAQEVFSRTWFGFSFDNWVAFQFPCGLIALLLSIFCMAGAIYSERDTFQSRHPGFRNENLPLCIFGVTAIWIAIGLLTANLWTTLSSRPAVEVAIHAETRMTLFIFCLFSLVVCMAVLLMQSAKTQVAADRGSARFHSREAIFCTLITVCGLFGIWKLTLRPAWADMAFRIGNIYEQNGNFTDAAGIYQRATELAPYVIPYRLSLGMALGTAGISDEGLRRNAVAKIESALRINPLDFSIYRSLGTLHMKIGESSPDPRLRSDEIKQAMKSFQKISQLIPAYPNSYCEVGRCFFLLGDYAQAKTLYQKALKLYPDYWQTYMFLGEMEYRRKELNGALQYFADSVRLNSSNIEGRKNVGFILALLGRREEAIRTNLETLKSAPQDSMLLTRLASLYFGAGNYSAGFDFARKAYDSIPAVRKPGFDQFLEQLKTAN